MSRKIDAEEILQLIDDVIEGAFSEKEKYIALRNNIEQMAEHASVSSDWKIVSYRPVIGWIIVLCKRVLRKLLSGYIPVIVSEQNEYNAMVLANQRRLLQYCRSLEEKIEEQNKKIELLNNLRDS